MKKITKEQMKKLVGGAPGTPGACAPASPYYCVGSGGCAFPSDNPGQVARGICRHGCCTTA